MRCSHSKENENEKKKNKSYFIKLPANYMNINSLQYLLEKRDGDDLLDAVGQVLLHSCMFGIRQDGGRVIFRAAIDWGLRGDIMHLHDRY